jgi:hypothetical protein
MNGIKPDPQDDPAHTPAPGGASCGRAQRGLVRRRCWDVARQTQSADASAVGFAGGGGPRLTKVGQFAALQHGGK